MISKNKHKVNGPLTRKDKLDSHPPMAPKSKPPGQKKAASEEPVTRSEFSNAMANIDQRFEGVDRRFEEVDRRFDKIDQRFDKIDKRFEKVDQRFDKMDQRFDRVENEVRGLGVQFEDLSSKMDQVLEICAPLMERTTDHEERITKIENAVQLLSPFQR